MNPDKKTLTARVPEYRDLDIGNYTFGMPKIMGATFDNLKIGKFVRFGTDVQILPGSTAACKQNATDFQFTDYFGAFVPKQPDDEAAPSIIIENDVIIGDRVTICQGAIISNGAIVLPGSVVNGKIDRYTLACGNPAVSIEQRFADEWVDALDRRVRWWEWPIDKILENQILICQPPGDHLMPLFGPRPESAKVKGNGTRRKAAEST